MKKLLASGIASLLLLTGCPPPNCSRITFEGNARYVCGVGNREVYKYDSFPMDVPVGEMAYPIDLKFDNDETLWVSSEFSKSVYSLAEGETSLTPHTVPQPSFPIFTLQDNPATISGLGEGLQITDDGNIWFTQGGGYLYEGELLNISRIIEYNPLTDEFKCYIPSVNNPQVFDVHLDDEDVYFTAGGINQGNFIGKFQPNSVTEIQSV